MKFEQIQENDERFHKTLTFHYPQTENQLFFSFLFNDSITEDSAIDIIDSFLWKLFDTADNIETELSEFSIKNKVVIISRVTLYNISEQIQSDIKKNETCRRFF